MSRANDNGFINILILLFFLVFGFFVLLRAKELKALEYLYPVQAGATPNWPVLTNKDFKISFKYPPSFGYVNLIEADGTNSLSWDLKESIPTSSITPQNNYPARLTITIKPNRQNLGVLQIIYDNSIKKIETETITVDNIEGVLFAVNENGTTIGYRAIFMNDGREYTFNFSGGNENSYKIFRKILSSIEILD